MAEEKLGWQATSPQLLVPRHAPGVLIAGGLPSDVVEPISQIRQAPPGGKTHRRFVREERPRASSTVFLPWLSSPIASLITWILVIGLHTQPVWVREGPCLRTGTSTHTHSRLMRCHRWITWSATSRISRTTWTSGARIARSIGM